MITVLIPRLGISHILNYRLHNGTLRTLCNIDLPKDYTITTLSADDTFPGICRTCKESQDKYYQDNLNYNLQSARNMVQEHYIYIRDYVQDEMMGPPEAYRYIKRKKWPKLEKLKLSLRVKTKVKKKK